MNTATPPSRTARQSRPADGRFGGFFDLTPSVAGRYPCRICLARNTRWLTPAWRRRGAGENDHWSATNARFSCGWMHVYGRPLQDLGGAAGLFHCDRCRPQSGSAFSTVIMIRRSTIEIEGETAVFDDIGSSGLYVARRYCPRCGSPLTTEPDVTPDLMFVNAGGIDADEWFHPVMELFVGRRRPWVAKVPGAQQLEGNPPI